MTVESMQKFLDLAETRCPLTFVLAKRAILSLQAKEQLTLQLNAAESLDDIRQLALKQGRDCEVLEDSEHITVTLFAVTKG